jgi:hypothetical protein
METCRCIRPDAMAATGPRNQFQSQIAARIAAPAASTRKTPAVQASLRWRARGCGAGASRSRESGLMDVSVVKPSLRVTQPYLNAQRPVRSR